VVGEHVGPYERIDEFVDTFKREIGRRVALQ